jgi:hypothetical protein
MQPLNKKKIELLTQKVQLARAVPTCPTTTAIDDQLAEVNTQLTAPQRGR